jgi:catechol 2,3-dioxygenase-like lactoylglutathione lyase family enzyme
VTPLGLEHVVLRVSDIERALPFYRMFFGAETTRTASSGPVWFQVARTRLGLVSAAAGEPPRIDHFCVRVEAFDAGAVTAGLSALGAQVHSSGNEAGVTLRFTDPDGISVELQAG